MTSLSTLWEWQEDQPSTAIRWALERAANVAIFVSAKSDLDATAAIAIGLLAARTWVEREFHRGRLSVDEFPGGLHDALGLVNNSSANAAVTVVADDLASEVPRVGDQNAARRLGITVEEHGLLLDAAAARSQHLHQVVQLRGALFVAALERAALENASEGDEASRWHEALIDCWRASALGGLVEDGDEIALLLRGNETTFTYIDIVEALRSSSGERFVFGLPPFPASTFTCGKCLQKASVVDAIEIRGQLLDWLTDLVPDSVKFIQMSAAERLADYPALDPFWDYLAWDNRRGCWDFGPDLESEKNAIQAIRSADAQWVRPADLQAALGLSADVAGGRAAARYLEIALALGFFGAGGRKQLPGCRPVCATCAVAALAALAAQDDPAPAASRSIPAQLRFAVLQRDGFRCTYCGATTADGARLHIDHIVPFSEGGPTELGNLQTACEACNLGKGIGRVID